MKKKKGTCDKYSKERGTLKQTLWRSDCEKFWPFLCYRECRKKGSFSLSVSLPLSLYIYIYMYIGIYCERECMNNKCSEWIVGIFGVH